MNDDQAIVPHNYKGETATAIRIGDRIIYDRHVELAHMELIFVDADGHGIASETISVDGAAWGADNSDLYTLALSHFNLTAA